MKRPFLTVNLAILALTLCALVLSAPASAAAAGNPTSVDEAQALKVAEMKLAALAKEGNGEPPAAAPAPREKKAPKKALRNKRAKAPRRGESSALPASAQKVLGRRLTPAEVQGILATTRDFSGTDLSGLNLTGVDLNGVKLDRANLQTANLERADLAEADLELADLSGANLRGASLNQARLRGTRLEGARLDGALWIDKTVCRKGSLGSCLQ